MPSFRTTRLLLLLLITLLPTPSWCREPTPPVYVSADLLPPLLLPPPPAEDTPDGLNQIHGVIKAQVRLSKTEIAALKAEQHLSLDLMTSVMPKNFTAERFPKTFVLLQNVFDDAENIANADKAFWHTRRPYLVDKRVTLYIDPIDSSPSYPSGHTTTSHVLAEVLGLIYPDKLTELRSRADAIAQHRIEAGVHYPVDIEGGQTLSSLIMGSLISTPHFQSDLELAKAEVSADQTTRSPAPTKSTY